MEIVNDIKRKYSEGNMIIKLIFINIAVFIVQLLFDLFGAGIVNSFFMFPSSMFALLTQPWSVVSYQFMHADFMHILFNMLWLYWFGEMFLYHFSQKQLLANYLLGGFSGAFLFFVSYNLIPQLSAQGAILVGASAATTAIGVAIASYRPNMQINLMLFGPVKIKYLVLVMIALDFLNIKQGQNVGGHFSHIGGAIFGFFYGMEMKKGNDLTKGFNRFLDWFFGLFVSRKSKFKVSYGAPRNEREKDFNYNAKANISQEEIDRILEKISRSGYDSLSADEKEKLFKASK